MPGDAIGRGRPQAAVPGGAHAPGLAAARCARQPAQGTRRSHEDGPDRQQLPARAPRVREIEGGQGAPEAAPERRQRRQDHGGAGVRHHRLRPEVLRAPAEGPGPAERLSRTSRSKRARWRCATARCRAAISSWRRARSGSIAGPCRASTMPASTRSSSPAPTSKSNFLCNLGYGDPAGLRPRGPRFAFDEMAKIL